MHFNTMPALQIKYMTHVSNFFRSSLEFEVMRIYQDH